jgi:hypothetical protein
MGLAAIIFRLLRLGTLFPVEPLLIESLRGIRCVAPFFSGNYGYCYGT